MTQGIDARVLTINIGLDAAPVTSAGFGLVAVAGPSTFAERSRQYFSAQEAAADSSDLTSAQLAGINRLFAANIVPSSVLAARVSFTLTAQVNTVTVTGNDDGAYTVTINGTNYTFTASSSTANDIAAGLQALVDADPAVVATVLANVVTITAASAGTGFDIAVTNVDTNLTLAETQPNVSPVSDLDALLADRTDWYGLVIDSRDSAVIQIVAAWAEANNRLFVAQANDADIKTTATTDLLSVLASNNYGRTAFIYHNSDTERADAAWASKLAVNPDTATTTWAHYTLVGVAVDSALSSTEITNIIGKNGNVYSTLLGIGATWDGKTVDGRFIDLRITADWTAARIQERVAQALLNASNSGNKIPFTSQGLAQIGSIINSVLTQGEDAGHFVPGTSSVGVPSLAEVASSDRAARCARFTFATEPAGAIHKTIINGTISIPVA